MVRASVAALVNVHRIARAFCTSLHVPCSQGTLRIKRVCMHNLAVASTGRYESAELDRAFRMTVVCCFVINFVCV